MTAKKIKRAARPHVPPQMKSPPEAPEVEPQEVLEQEPVAEAENPEAEAGVNDFLGPLGVEVPPGIDIAAAIKMAQPLIDQAVADNLSKMNLPELIKGAVKGQVDEQLRPLIEMAKERFGGAIPGTGAIPDNPEYPASPPAAAPSAGGGEAQAQIFAMILNKILGGGNSGGGTNLSQLAETLKGVHAIAELANAPYRQGRMDTLQETNQTLKLIRGLGVDSDKSADILISATTKELNSNNGDNQQ